MTNTEQTLLNLLHEDAKLTDEQLATMLGKSEREIRDTITRMEQAGIIIGYGAVVNSEATDNDSVSALIEVKITPQRDRGFDAIARTIYSFPEVKACYLMSGAFDLMVIVEGDNIRQVGQFVSEKLSTLDNVLSCATHFILKRYKQDGRLLTNENDEHRQAVTP